MNDKRIEEMFYWFSQCVPMPIENKYIQNLQNALGGDIIQVFRSAIQGIGYDMIKPENKSDAKDAIIWIRDACNYILEESDDYPKTKQITTKDGIRISF